MNLLHDLLIIMILNDSAKGVLPSTLKNYGLFTFLVNAIAVLSCIVIGLVHGPST